MAIPTAVNDILQLRVYCTLGPQTAINVLHYRITAVTGTGDLASAVGPWDLALAQLYKDCMAGVAQYRGITLQRVSGAPSATVSSVANAGNGSNGSPLPNQTCGIIRSRTAFSGRKEHGRTYVPFPAEDTNASPSVPNAAYMTFAGALAAQLLDDGPYVSGADGVTVVPCLVSRTDGLVRNITTMTVIQKWATQRRRGNFGKTNPSPI